jgi:fibronectin type 3 domain-containing protein
MFKKSALFRFVLLCCWLFCITSLSWSAPCINVTINGQASSGTYGCPYTSSPNSFQGVIDTSNGDWLGSGTGNFSCVELVKKFYDQFFGININEAVGTAAAMYNNYTGLNLKKFGLDIFTKGGTVGPRMGDIIVWGYAPSGHVAIFVSLNTDGTAKVFEQNYSTNAFRNNVDVTSGSSTALGWLHLAVGSYADGWHGNDSSKSFITAFNLEPKVGSAKDIPKIGFPNDNGGTKYVHLWLGQADQGFGVMAQDYLGDMSIDHYGTDAKSVLILNDLLDIADPVKAVYRLSGGIYGYYKMNDGPYSFGVPRTPEIKNYCYANSHLVLANDNIKPGTDCAHAKQITVQKFKRRTASGLYFNEQRRTLVYDPASGNTYHFPVGEFSIDGSCSAEGPSQWYVQGLSPALDIAWPMKGVLSPTGRWFTKPGTYNFVRHDANNNRLMGSGFTANIAEGNYQFAGNASTDVPIPQNVTAWSLSQNGISISWNKPFDTTISLSYNIYRSTNQSFGSSGLIASTVNNVYTDVGLVANTKYYYWVKSVLGSELSDYSNAVSATTQSSPGNGTTPTAPSNVTCAFEGSSQVKVSWSCGANDPSNIGSYQLFMGTTNNSAQASYYAATVNPWQEVSGLSQSTTYYFWIKAFNHSGISSGYSSVVSVTTANYVYPPENLTAVNSNGSVNLSWSCQSSGVVFKVYRSSAADFSNQSMIFQTTALYFVDNDGQAGATYYYRVCSGLNGLVSDYSNDVSATFTTFPPPANFRIVEVISNEVKLAWDRSPGTIYNYYLYRYFNGNQQWVRFVTDTFCVDSTVEPGKTYSYKVRAHSLLISAFSREVFAAAQSRFTYSGSWVCDSIVDGSLPYSKAARNVITNVNQGGNVSLLAELRNIYVNHRIKVDIYYNGTLSWTWGGTNWNNVGTGGWSYSYATPCASNCQPGYYEFRTSLDTGNGFWQIDSKTFSVAQSGPQYTYSGSWVCDSVVDGTIPYSKVPRDQKTEFTQGSSIYCLAVLQNISVNHRIKVDVYKDGYYLWTWGDGNWNIVNGTWTYSNAIVQQSNAAPGNYQFNIYLDIGNGYQQIDVKTCHVSAVGPGYTYFGSWTCDSVADGTDPYSKIAVNSKANFVAGHNVYCLSVFQNVYVNHRIKIDVYQNGTYSWTWGGTWNNVGAGWTYSNAALMYSQISAGAYQFKINIDTGSGYQLIETKSITVN